VVSGHPRGGVRKELCGWLATSTGRCSHRCCRTSQVACTGAGKSGSANVPTATPTIDGRRSGSHHTVDPHTPQKWEVTAEPLSDPRLNWDGDPCATVTCSLAKNAPMPKSEPVRRWQSRQWQSDTAAGSPLQRITSCPHWHAASRIMPRRRTQSVQACNAERERSAGGRVRRLAFPARATVE